MEKLFKFLWFENHRFTAAHEKFLMHRRDGLVLNCWSTSGDTERRRGAKTRLFNAISLSICSENNKIITTVSLNKLSVSNVSTSRISFFRCLAAKIIYFKCHVAIFFYKKQCEAYKFTCYLERHYMQKFSGAICRKWWKRAWWLEQVHNSVKTKERRETGYIWCPS